VRVIAVYNIKGGVGKTATAVNLAYLSAASGARTLLWDLDPQGAATFYYRIRPRLKGGVKKLIRGKKPIDRHIRGTDFEGLDLLPADFSNRKLDLTLDASGDPRKRIARLIKPLAKDYDHLYLDCAPNISLASEGVFAAADALLVPSIPTTLSNRTLEQLRRHLDEEGPSGLKVLPFHSMVDRRKAMHREVCGERRSNEFDFLEAEIPYASVVEQMGNERAPLMAYAPNSDAAAAYEKLWREMLTRTNSIMGWLGLRIRRGR
jgi:cellulose biosynthesis protein BcsQ